MFRWPAGLERLENYLRARGIDPNGFKTARQAAWQSQNCLRTRHKFDANLVETLKKIQDAVPGSDPAEKEPTRLERHAKKLGRGQRSYPTDKPRREPFNEEQVATGVHVFADGACEPNPGAGGWGVVIYRDGVEIAVSCGGDPNATNNKMELTALLNAIEKAAQVLQEHPEIPVTIWCDSAYCVQGVNEWRYAWKKNDWQRGGPKAKPKNRILANADLWKAIDEALVNLPAGQVIIRWVKGHAGIVGNERADELSSLGRQQAIKQTRPNAAPPALAIPVNESAQSVGFEFAPVDIGEN